MNSNKDINNLSYEDLRRRKLIITVIISVAVYILILISFKIYSNYNKNKLENELARSYEKEVYEYLQNKYNEEFYIEFVRKGYKARDVGLDSDTGYCGHDRNVDEYLYEFSPKNNSNIKHCYIAYWYYKEDDKKLISEIEDKRQISSSEEIRTYEDSLKCYEQKLKIKDELERYLGNDYTINLFDNNASITAETNKTLREIISKDEDEYINLYNNLVSIIHNSSNYKQQDHNIKLYLKYKDKNIRINYISNKIDKKQLTEIINYKKTDATFYYNEIHTF